MFSNNGKISAHQAVRLLILDVFTGGCLFLPMALPQIAGDSGWIACVLGIVWMWAEGQLIFRCMRVDQRKQRIHRKNRWEGIGRMILGARCFAVYSFLAALYLRVLSETFLYTMPEWLILAGMLGVLMYGSFKGLEMRARLSEILIYLTCIPVFLISLFSLPEADWSQLRSFSEMSYRGIGQGILVTWVMLSPLEWLMFLKIDEMGMKRKKHTNIQETVCTVSYDALKLWNKALGIGGGLILLIYGVCQSVLGSDAMGMERWPTVLLMQIIKIPGGFLSRQDGLMLSFWIFAMYISLSGALSHGVSLWGEWLSGVWQRCQKHETADGSSTNILRTVTVICAAGGVWIAYFAGMSEKFLNLYFYGMIISGIGCFWLLPCARFLWQWIRSRRMRVMGLIVCVIGLTVGCENYVELENRAFVMTMGVDLGEKARYRFIFEMPDISAMTGNGSGQNEEPVILEADSLASAEEWFNRISEQRLDYGQVKVLVMNTSFGEDINAVTELMKEIRQKPEMSRTILLCKSDYFLPQMIQAEGVSNSAGTYIENLLKNQSKEVILNDFINDPQMHILPEIGLWKDRICVLE